ncbi:hypothetical protein ABT314_21170, partial [Streptomyces spiralis]
RQQLGDAGAGRVEGGGVGASSGGGRARDEATGTLRRDLRALGMLALRPVGEGGGTAMVHVRNRLIGYREEENLPPAPPAVQDVFRGIGEAARAVLGLRIALAVAPDDESDDAPATVRSREELEAENAASVAVATKAGFGLLDVPLIKGEEKGRPYALQTWGLHRP